MPSTPLRVIVSGGGTGGHIYPALAIATEIRRRFPDAEILFVGAEGRMEMQKVPAAGFAIKGLNIAGFQRRLTLKNLSFPFKVIGSFLSARAILKEFKPQIAVGFGGYASGPMLFAAAMAGVPTIIQEQNSYAGITNKLLSKKAIKICVAYPGLEKYFPADKLVFTGNPVRADIADLKNKREEAAQYFQVKQDRKVLLVLGGSLGAKTINDCLMSQYKALEEAGIQTIWQTGKNFFSTAETHFKNNPTEHTKAYSFLERMDLAYAIADVVISRAGALSISELCLVAKPAILVPSPNVAEDHQTKNAMALANVGAAVVVSDNEAGKSLIKKTVALFSDLQLQSDLSIAIDKLAKPQAASDITNEILKVLQKA